MSRRISCSMDGLWHVNCGTIDIYFGVTAYMSGGSVRSYSISAMGSASRVYGV